MAALVWPTAAAGEGDCSTASTTIDSQDLGFAARQYFQYYIFIQKNIIITSASADSCGSCVFWMTGLATVLVTSWVSTLVSVLNSVAVISLTEESRIVVTMGLPRKVMANSVDSVSVTWLSYIVCIIMI